MERPTRITRRAGRQGSTVRRLALGIAGFWKDPVATTKRWRWTRRYPRPRDFDRMAPDDFDAYLHTIGFDVRIAAAVAESEDLAGPARSDPELRSGSGVAST